MDSVLGDQWLPAFAIPLPRVRPILLHAKFGIHQSWQRLVDPLLPLRGVLAYTAGVFVSSRSSLHHQVRHASRLGKIFFGDQQIRLLGDVW